MFFNWKAQERIDVSQAKLRPTQMPSKAKGKDFFKDLTIFVSMFGFYFSLDFQVVNFQCIKGKIKKVERWATLFY